jgi:glycosyltransferase involved in cell wall biosynthesis
MRILVVNYEYPPIGGGGGSSCKEIVDRLDERGHVVDVFTSGYKNFPVIEKQGNNVKIYRIKSNRKSEHEAGAFGIISFLARAMFRISKFASKKRYDIIHYHFSVPTGFLTFFHGNKTPYIVTLHGIGVPGFHADEFPLFQKITKPFNKRIIKKASAVVAVSENLKSKALETFKDQDIHVIYHGVDMNKFKPLDVDKNKNTVDFICVARLVKFKRIDVLLKAFKMLLDKTGINGRLTIAGTGYMESELKELAGQLNIVNNVKFSGYVPHEKLPELINRHDIFVLPSVYDSFGIVFAEAMACGLPCIGANASGVPEVVKHGVTGLLAKPDDVKSFYECMRQLAQDKQQLKQMGENAYSLVKEKFDWNSIVDSYERLFNLTALQDNGKDENITST